MENPFTLKIRKDKVFSTIKTAGWLGIILSILTIILVIPLYSLLGITNELLIWLTVISALGYIILSFGFFFKNRFFSVLFLIFYGLDSLLVLSFSNVLGGLIRILFFMYFLRGVKAVFVYNKYLKR